MYEVKIIEDAEEIENIISQHATSFVANTARKQLKCGHSCLVEIKSWFFYHLQDMGSNLFFAEVADIMKKEFGVNYKNYWFLNVTLPKRPAEPVVYVVLNKNM